MGAGGVTPHRARRDRAAAAQAYSLLAGGRAVRRSCPPPARAEPSPAVPRRCCAGSRGVEREGSLSVIGTFTGSTRCAAETPLALGAALEAAPPTLLQQLISDP
jgi:hypothetical protein